MNKQPAKELNKAGFIGGASGSSLLLVIYAIGSVGNDNRLAISFLVCIATIVAGHSVIWSRRSKITAHAGMQLSIVNILVGYLLAFVAMDYFGYLHAIAVNQSDPRSSYLLLLVFPLLSLVIYINQKNVL